MAGPEAEPAPWRDALCVTTATDPSPAMLARAALVARRCGVPTLARRDSSVARLVRRARRELVYVVGREREELRGPDEQLHVHPGLFYLRRESGAAHPLVRALAPPGEPPPGRILDATIGMAGDALSLADALGVEVVGVEGSPVIASLLEEGVPRLATMQQDWSAGASRIRVVHGRALTVLRETPAGAFDAVYLDPMFETPLAAQVGFDLLRRVAVHDPLDDALLSEALRVAARRVILKVPASADAPAGLGAHFARRERGRACDFLVAE